MIDDKLADLPLAEGELAPCGIYIDLEGIWYHRASPMHRSDIVALLCQHLRRDKLSGRYIIQMGKQRCYLEVEDTPLVITGVFHEQKSDGSANEQLFLSIKHLDVRERLDPTTLWVGRDNVLYCRVREDRIPARFLRPAYYQLAKFIDEDHEQGRFYLLLSGEQYYIEQLPAGSSRGE